MTSTLQEARESIEKEGLPDLIVLNARLDGPVEDSEEFAKELKKYYSREWEEKDILWQLMQQNG